MDLKVQRVVVMGGTAGMGLATATELAARGAEVIATGRDERRVAAARETVGAAEVLDTTSPGQVHRFFKRLGVVDHMVLTLGGPKGWDRLPPWTWRSSGKHSTGSSGPT